MGVVIDMAVVVMMMIRYGTRAVITEEKLTVSPPLGRTG
jgi:hypothetical protein